MVVPVIRAMAVIATGNRKPDRRAARLLPELRLRCCDKAVLPSAMHSGAGRPRCGPLRCSAACRVMASGVLPGPAPGTARAHGPSALGHRRYLARRTGGIPEDSRKKQCRVVAATDSARHRGQRVSVQSLSVISPPGRGCGTPGHRRPRACGWCGYTGAGSAGARLAGARSAGAWLVGGWLAGGWLAGDWLAGGWLAGGWWALGA